MSGMLICYVDESGDARPVVAAHSEISPICVIAGISFPHENIRRLTSDFLALKRELYPNLARGARRGQTFDQMLFEIKGSEIRRNLRDGMQSRNRRHSIRCMDGVINLLERYGAKIVGRVWVKAVGAPCNQTALFSYSMQQICTHFQHLLATQDRDGIIVGDFRTPQLNSGLAHSVFTQKYQAAGDVYSRLLELPTFGHSQNHVGLQVADLVASAFLFPMASHAFCRGHITGPHVNPGFERVCARYGTRIARLQYRYVDGLGKWAGGVTVDDDIGHRRGGLLFRTP